MASVGQRLEEAVALLGAQDTRAAQAQVQRLLAAQVALEVAHELERWICSRRAGGGERVYVVERVEFCSRQVPSSSPSATQLPAPVALIHTLDKDVRGPVSLDVRDQALPAAMERGVVVLADSRGHCV